MQKTKAILFDNDGTIVDTEKPILTSFRYMLEKVLGHCTDADIKKFKSLIGLPSYDQFKEFSSDEATIQNMIQTYRAHNDTILDDMLENFEGLPEVLANIKSEGYYMGIVTSKRHDICLRGLKILGIDKYFDYLQGCDDWNVHKPDPGAITHACEQIGYPPAEVMYVGDSIYDIQAGNGAGCKTCAVCWGVFPREDLAKAKPTFIIEHPTELLRIL